MGDSTKEESPGVGFSQFAPVQENQMLILLQGPAGDRREEQGVSACYT